MARPTPTTSDLLKASESSPAPLKSTNSDTQAHNTRDLRTPEILGGVGVGVALGGALLGTGLMYGQHRVKALEHRRLTLVRQDSLATSSLRDNPFAHMSHHDIPSTPLTLSRGTSLHTTSSIPGAPQSNVQRPNHPPSPLAGSRRPALVRVPTPARPTVMRFFRFGGRG